MKLATKLKILFSALSIIGLVGLYLALFVYDIASLPAIYICGAVTLCGMLGNAITAVNEAVKQGKEVKQ